MRIGINGFGRIGRQVMRIAYQKGGIEIAHINDITDAKTLAHLLKYDSTFGVWNRAVSAEENAIVVDGKRIPVTAEKDPKAIPWGASGVDMVLESTGVFRQKGTSPMAYRRRRRKRCSSPRPARTPSTATLSSASTTSFTTRPSTTSSRSEVARRTASPPSRWSCITSSA